MKITHLGALAAVLVFAASASAGVIMNSTEIFPLGNANATWGKNADPMLGWTSAKASWGKFDASFGQTNVPSHTADGSGVLRNKTTGGGSGVNVIQFTSTPGTSYALSGYVQRDIVANTWTEYQLVDGSNWAAWDTGGFCTVISTPATGTWYSFGKTVQATGTVMTILLKAGSTGAGAPNAFWDDINIIPEPASLLMLAPAVLLLRRRRT